MPKFFLDGPIGERVLLTGEDGRHAVKSLRMRPGEQVTLCDGHGTDYEGEILSVSGETAEIRVLGSHPCPAEPTVEATLFQSLPKLDKCDSVVQKAVELGVSRIVPVVSARCVSRPEEKALAKKTERWQRIAAEAAKQCGRGILPAVETAIPFSRAVRRAKEEGGTALLFYEGGGVPLPSLVGPETRRVSLFIGPEGGFAPEEVSLAQENGLQPATLGPRILRTETAPVAALAAIMLCTGNLGGNA